MQPRYRQGQPIYDWVKLFDDFMTFQFGAGQAQGMVTIGRCTEHEADSWEASRTDHYGIDRAEMIRLLRDKLGKK